MATAPPFETLVGLFEVSCKSFATRALFGFKDDGSWVWKTYGQVKSLVDRARSGLSQLGVKQGDTVAIIANNRLEWAVLAYGTYSLGAAFVPMYESQSEQDWAFIIADSGADVVITAHRSILQQVKTLTATLPHAPRHLLCLEGEEGDPHSYAHLLKQGATALVDPVHPDPNDLCCLIYTSGTTGKPKGVRLSHRNIVSNVRAAIEVFPFSTEDRSLSFLPWAHCFGQICELHCLLGMGASMALNSSVDKLLAELSEVQPTLLISVPRIYLRIYEAVHKQMASRPAVIRHLFTTGLQAAEKRNRGESLGLKDQLLYHTANRLIFGKVRDRFGGRLQWTVSGGAALAREVAAFIDNLGIIVYEGYGLSETSPVVAANCPAARRLGSVGKPFPGVRVVIDTNLSDEPNQGEIVVYGPNVMLGYHQQEAETKAIMTDDGGLRSGDLGYLDRDGFLWVTGRLKEQYKLENGKYVAPAPLEDELKLSPIILNAMVCGENKPYNVAVVVPDPDEVKKVAAQQNLKGSYAQLLESAAVKSHWQQEVDRINQRFRSFDRIRRFLLVDEDFSVQNDMLTPKLSLKRRTISKQWGSKLQALYT